VRTFRLLKNRWHAVEGVKTGPVRTPVASDVADNMASIAVNVEQRGNLGPNLRQSKICGKEEEKIRELNARANDGYTRTEAIPLLDQANLAPPSCQTHVHFSRSLPVLV
jgi:hypothetical protein